MENSSTSVRVAEKAINAENSAVKHGDIQLTAIQVQSDSVSCLFGSEHGAEGSAEDELVNKYQCRGRRSSLRRVIASKLGRTSTFWCCSVKVFQNVCVNTGCIRLWSAIKRTSRCAPDEASEGTCSDTVLIFYMGRLEIAWVVRLTHKVNSSGGARASSPPEPK